MIEMHNIVIIDDHSLFLKGLEGLIQEEFPKSTIHCFESIDDCCKVFQNFDLIQLLISDIELPNENVFEFFKCVKKSHKNLPILVITMHKKLSVIRKCKRLNINGYLLKDDDDLLHEALKEILLGKTYYSSRIEKLYRLYAKQLNTLSPREEDVSKMIGLGLSNKEIADKLFISIETVKTHKRNIKRKLGLSEHSDLIRYANEHFLI